jgi:B12-binding domain/radical SAM domain protein
MKSDIALVVFYNRPNKYSFNALMGALETDSYFDGLHAYFPINDNELFKSIETAIQNHEITVVCFSFSTPQLWEMTDIMSQLRRSFSSRIFCIAGGPHPTGDTEGTLKLGFDIVVRYEGEETIIDLLKAIDNKDDFRNIKGIAFLDEKGEHHFMGRRNPIDLMRYPPISNKYKKYGPIEITRGCPFVCAFCQTPFLFGSHVRHRSIEQICESIELMMKRNLKDVRVITPNALSYGSPDGRIVNLKSIEELLQNMRKTVGKEGRIFFGSFPSEVRPEQVTEESLQVLAKYIDNDNLIIGAQSGSERILELCNRGHTVSDAFNAVSLALKAGFKANVDFIFGLPGETLEDLRKTAEFIIKLTKMGAKIHAHTFTPLPQTKFAKAIIRPLGRRTLKIINDLIPRGFIYGDWREQEKFAQRISHYLLTRQINGED